MWFSMRPTRRAKVLTACLIASDNGTAARKFLEEQIIMNRDMMPKYWMPLELLHKRVFPTATVNASDWQP